VYVYVEPDSVITFVPATITGSAYCPSSTYATEPLLCNPYELASVVTTMAIPFVTCDSVKSRVNVTLPPEAAWDAISVAPVVMLTFTADAMECTAYVALNRYEPGLSVVYVTLDCTGWENVITSAFTTLVKLLARLLALAFVAAFSLNSGWPMLVTSYVRLTANSELPLDVMFCTLEYVPASYACSSTTVASEVNVAL
jgi:hypothetical protein